jgi:hypothetical protein
VGRLRRLVGAQAACGAANGRPAKQQARPSPVVAPGEDGSALTRWRTRADDRPHMRLIGPSKRDFHNAQQERRTGHLDGNDYRAQCTHEYARNK